MSIDFVPQAGDLVWLTFDPQAGREQAGRRPALILSPGPYNSKTGLALVCPVTNQAKGYPFEVPIPNGCGVSGVILADHLKNVDWRERRAEWIGVCPMGLLEMVRAKIAPLLGT